MPKGSAMRIVHIETFNQVATAYAEALDRRGHTSTILHPSLAGGGASLPGKLAKMPGRLLDLRQITRQLTPAQYDIAHIHWASYGILGLRSQIPFVVTCHGSDVRYRARDPRFRPMLRAIFRRAGAVLCITPDILPPVRSLREDVRFLPAAVNTELLAPDAERRDRPWTVLLFSRLEKMKGSDIAVAALTRFQARHPDVRIILLDWGPLSPGYQQAFAGQFEFLPKVPPADVQTLLSQADVVVGQFFLGALGLSELQAMSCATPVIASDRHPEAYPTPPPLCDASTPDMVEAHLERLYQRPDEARALGQQARVWVIAHHGYDVIGERLESIYRPLLSRGGKS